MAISVLDLHTEFTELDVFFYDFITKHVLIIIQKQKQSTPRLTSDSHGAMAGINSNGI